MTRTQAKTTKRRAASRRHSLALLVVLGAGCDCGADSAALTLDLDPDAPVAIERVEARLTTMAVLGSGTTTLGSDSDENSVAFDVAARIQEGHVPEGGVAAHPTCRFDDHAWAGSHAGLGDLGSVSAGAEQQLTVDAFMPNPFAQGPPTACEVTLRYRRARPEQPGDEPFEERELAQFCWQSEQGLTAGACPDGVVGRNPADDPIVVDEIAANWEAVGSEHVLRVGAVLRTGSELRRVQVVPRVSCAGLDDGPPRQSDAGLFFIHELAGGESLFESGTGFQSHPYSESGAQCTITLSEKTVETAGNRITLGLQPIASFCFDGQGGVSTDACPGLSAGPSALRVSAEGVSIVRGSHVEGPFHIAEGASDESIERVVSSLGETGERAVNVVADETTPTAFMVSLLGAMNATDLLVALADGRSAAAALAELEADVAEPTTETSEETSGSR